MRKAIESLLRHHLKFIYLLQKQKHSAADTDVESFLGKIESGFDEAAVRGSRGGNCLYTASALVIKQGHESFKRVTNWKPKEFGDSVIQTDCYGNRTTD